ncbi:armadillo-type protein [Podospora australis]|uniref:Armadillo-type protein n=1 Tax=Podospora australis TaxID=1536484 RepID=A0AAN7ALC6_9PEZI|nr:armadillo-type protein [Podospora australis]
MDPNASEKNARQKLMQSLMDIGTKAYSPEAAESSSRAEAGREYEDLIQRTKTFNLLAALNVLVRPGYVPPWLRTKLMEALTLIPLREDGVRATMEFVFAVHPSSTVKVSEAAVPQKKGANITHEALNMASNLLSAPPASVSPEKWYSSIAPQLLVLLDGAEGPELMKTAAYIIGFGVLGRKASGAPGTAGWKYLAEPLLYGIKPPPGFAKSPSGDDTDEIIDLSKEKVLVKYDELVTALRRLHSLVVSHPNPGLCKRLLSPLLLPFWALSTWKDASPSLTEEVRKPAAELLKVHSKLVPSPSLIPFLVQNLGYTGGHNKKNQEWVYKAIGQDQICIIDATQPSIGRNGPVPQITLEDIDAKIPKLLDLLTSTFSDADISAAFIELLKRWLESARNLKGNSILIKREEEERDPLGQFIEIKTLQAMMERFPEKLATQPKHILDLVSQILAGSDESTDEDEVTGVALSLLNMIVTVPGFQKSRVNPETLSLIETSLDRLSKADTDIAKTANNLRLLLLYRDELDDQPSSASGPAPTDRQIEDRKTYSLAISYITATDSPPPVRSEGLSLISSLITSQSPVLDIPGILVLLSSLISDSDEYIYLRIIKLYTQLATHHPRAVTTELLDHFFDKKETRTLDARLRFAEALGQVIERLGQTFTGPLAETVAETLLSIAGRRAHRPKTEAHQIKEEQLQQKKNKEAAEMWGGSVPDFSDPLPEDEKIKNEILEKIVEGWESKRGEEDIRIRASALSILSTGIETNIAGLGPMVVNKAVDLCVSVLSLEPEPEKGILRRAAVYLVLTFVKALDNARKEGRNLGFGFGAKAQKDVGRTLRYVADTDNDGLVVQHARDVLESLENWQVTRFLPEVRESSQGLDFGVGGGLNKLAGLEVDLERVALQREEDGKPSKPRIEEIA